MEQWLPIEGFEDYTISNTGKVKSKFFKDSNKCLKPGLGKRGYYCVNLHKDKKAYTKYLHRLIAEAFIPNPTNKPIVDHIDRNPLNNSISNLRWVNNKENVLNSSRKTNTGELYITLSYRVNIEGNSKYYNNLEDAIKARDDYLKSCLS